MSPLAVTIVDQWSDGKRLFVVGTLAFSGNYTQVTGEPLTFASTSIQSMQVPRSMDVWPSVSGYVFGYTKGTTRDNGFLRIYSAAPATELAGGAYPASITGDANLQFMGVFPWGV